MKSRSIMLQGTSSDVGKSVLGTGLCRIFARRGISVAPFKAQNMALNSYVTLDGLEMGRAQVDQARAAGIEPSVEMNPVLLKPEGHSRSQVVVMGRPMRSLSALDYHERKKELWGYVTGAVDALRAKFDLLIVEGAGSPVEINLKSNDIVNMRVATYLNSPVLLIGDIDRGGVFASLYGTMALLDDGERELVKGFLINKFRGDPALIGSGLDMLRELTGRPTLGLVPHLEDLGVAQEDSVFLEGNSRLSQGNLDVAVIGYPRTSNYDDLDSLAIEPDVGVRFVRSPSELGQPDCVILPGSKSTVADLLWMRDNGLERSILALASKGTSIVGICGGFQMMGRLIRDPDGIESDDPHIRGMGLLDVETDFIVEKRTVRTRGQVIGKGDSFVGQRGMEVEGYEIHMGRTVSNSPIFSLPDGPDGASNPSGRIWGTYLHGVFDLPEFRRSWLTALGWSRSGEPLSLKDFRERAFDRLADHMEEHIDMRSLEAILGL